MAKKNMKESYVYIMANRCNGTFYIGATVDIIRRVWEHKEGITEGFTKRYGIHRLVYYEIHDDIANALLRKKQLKKWKRHWKFRLIEENNENWDDLYDSLL